MSALLKQYDAAEDAPPLEIKGPVLRVGNTVVPLNYTSPRLSFEVYECALPLTFDQYSRCTFRCRYCFSAFQKSINAGGSGPNRQLKSQYDNLIRGVDPKKFRKLFEAGFAAKEDGLDGRINLIRRRVPLHWGGLSDPFDPFEKKIGLGLQILEMLSEWKYPTLFSTKGTFQAYDKTYRDVLARGDYGFQFSIITGDEKISAAIDAGVSSPEDRLKAMRVLVDAGHQCTLRFRPLIPGAVSVAGCVDLVERAHRAGATGVSTEFFCMEKRGSHLRTKYDSISKTVGFDIYEFYRRNPPGQHGYLRLTPEFKRPFFLAMREKALEHGMRFAVSDYHGKELGTGVGCCGAFTERDEVDGRLNMARGTFTAALMHAKEHGRVEFSDIEKSLEWADVATRKTGINGICGGTGCAPRFINTTLSEVFALWWDDLSDGKNPAKMYSGALAPDGLGADGHRAYRYVGLFAGEVAR